MGSEQGESIECWTAKRVNISETNRKHRFPVYGGHTE